MIRTITSRLVAEKISEQGFYHSPFGDSWYHPRGFRLERIGTAFRLERPGTDRVCHISTRKRRPAEVAEDIGEQLKRAIESL